MMRCRACGNTEDGEGFEEVPRLVPTDVDDWAVWVCGRCGSEDLDGVPAPDAPDVSG